MAIRNNIGAFVATTNVWDVAQLHQMDVNSPEFKELLVRLYQNVNNIAILLNLKDTGYYQQNEFVNGQLFFPNPAKDTQQFRQVYRTVIDFGTLPNATTKSVAHNIPITVGVTFTRIYATASDTIGSVYIPIPFVDTGGDEIQLDVDATDVNITTTSDRTNFTICYVVLEYLKM